MRRNSLRAVITAAVLTGLTLSTSPALADTPVAPYSSTAESQECRDLRNINATRAQHGLPPLRGLQMDLTYYARTHARDMAARGEWWHDMAALKAALPAGWNRYGENVAYNSQGIDAIHQWYLNSPRHRANILDPRYTAVGIGVWHDSRGTVWNSEEFVGGRSDWPVLDCSGTADAAPSSRTTRQQAASLQEAATSPQAATSPEPVTSPEPATSPEPVTSSEPATSSGDRTASSGTASSAGAPTAQKPAAAPAPPAGPGTPSVGAPSGTGASSHEASAVSPLMRAILADMLAWLLGILRG